MKVPHYNLKYVDTDKKCCSDCIIPLLQRLVTIPDLSYASVPIITYIKSNDDGFGDDLTAALAAGLVVKVNDHRAFAKEHKRVILQMAYPINEECSICLFTMKNQVVAHTPCGHRFHSKCLSICREYKKNAPCPLCRGALTDTRKMIDDGIDDYIDVLIQSSSERNGTTFHTPMSLVDEMMAYVESIPEDSIGNTIEAMLMI
jgi:hypothetical protein